MSASARPRWFEAVSATLAVAAIALAACSDGGEESGDDELLRPFSWALPAGFAEPLVPADNPMSYAKIELGRHLFYDQRLSGTGEFSCASCHEQALAFTDAKPVGIGATGEAHPRNSMSLTNAGYNAALNWSNPVVARLEQQALIPMFGEHPVELGLAGKEDELLATLGADTTYQRLFGLSYPDDAAPVSLGNVTKALSTFQRALISGDSPYDRYRYGGQAGAISASAKRGEDLFFSERLECFHCHSGFNLTAAATYVGKPFTERAFFNNGLYNIDGAGAYPAPNVGLIEFTGRPDDMGKFKAPTLRNIAVTAPYMHDGSIATLDEVLDHYAAGGRTITSGPNAGAGSASPLKDGFVLGFTLTGEERADVLAFLLSLTDQTFLSNPRFANPWRAGSPARP
jgi:cytochrome c peroxidase